MNVEVTEETLIMNGFPVGDKIMISDADMVSVINKETGNFEDVEPIIVTLHKEILKTWIEEYGILDDLGINV